MDDGQLFIAKTQALQHLIVSDLQRLALFDPMVEDPAYDGIAADFVWQHLFDESFMILARSCHPLSEQTISLAQFSDAEHIMIFGDTGMLTSLEQHFSEHGIIPNIVVRTSVGYDLLMMKGNFIMSDFFT